MIGLLLVGCDSSEISRTPIRQAYDFVYESQSIDIQPPEIYLESIYEGAQQFRLDDYFQYQGELMLKCDGKMVTSEYLDLDFGNYEFVAASIVDGKESPYVFFDVSVVKDKSSLEDMIYDKPYGEGERIYTNTYDHHDVEFVEYHLREEGLDTWYFIKNKNTAGYVQEIEDFNYVKKAVFKCQAGDFIMDQLPHEVKIGQNYYVIDGYERDYLLNATTADFIEGERFEVSPDGQFYVTYEENDITIYKLSGEVVYQKKWTGESFSYVFDQEKLLIHVNQSGWTIANDLGEGFQEIYEVDLETFEMKRQDSQLNLNYDVYENRSYSSKRIGRLSGEAFKDVFPILFVSMAPDGLTRWYQLENGYVAIPEDKKYLYDYSLVDSKGEMLNISFRIRRNDPIKERWYLLSSGRHEACLYNCKTDELVPLKGEIFISPDENYMIEFDDEEEKIWIYEYKNNAYVLIEEVVVGKGGHIIITWLEDGDFLLTTNEYQPEVDPWLYTAQGHGVNHQYLFERKGHSYIYDLTIVPEEVVIYEDTNQRSKLLGVTSHVDSQIEPLYLYEMIDEKLHLWFKVVSNDITGYAHRPVRYLEGSYGLDSEQVAFNIESGDTVVYESEGVISIDNKLLSLGFYGVRSESNYHLIHIESGATIDLKGMIVVSPNKKMVCTTYVDYEDDVAYLTLYGIDETGLSLIQKLAVDQGNFYDIEWLDNQTIRVLNEHYSGLVNNAGYITKKDDHWIFEWGR